MFDRVKLVLDWIILMLQLLTDTFLYRLGFIGVGILGMAILRKIVDIWRYFK